MEYGSTNDEVKHPPPNHTPLAAGSRKPAAYSNLSDSIGSSFDALCAG
jgi:hypothetical protein